MYSLRVPPSRLSTPKVIADPVYGIFDIRPVLPMVETAEFQALADKRQLGMSYLVYPSATHTRRAHSLGAYHATRELADRWIRLGLITRKEGDALAGYALYHDIGHPAFSHVTEDLTGKTNDALSLEIVKRLRKPIEASGVDFKLLVALAAHKNPLHEAVSDKNLGTEKLDYLERDGLYTILSRPVGIDYLRKHILFVKKRLVVDEKGVDSAIETQNFYLKIYKNVYLRKASVIAQRMLQKMVYHLILAREITTDDLVRLTDSELIGIMRVSQSSLVRTLYGYLKTRDLFRETIAVKHARFLNTENKAGKAIARFGLKEKEMERLICAPKLQPKNQDALKFLEQRIAALAKLPREAILVAPVFYPSRFTPKDVTIYTEGGKFESLKKRYPAHVKSMEETGRAYAAFRVCTLERYRKVLGAPRTARRVFELVMREAKR